ncbi:hypothetical protein GGR21_002919 [Dysgonomonas hofstadii]|uniref:Pirin n=1 Tax=Dysgonomonas hofstadii TaxID=637886 RepID=A0A840CW17_9BACT|nr:pirin family protein [Dysgonomonas hofstadii]MBB4037005.1 hypothetical protein [Dysgonomonas hofstadii]
MKVIRIGKMGFQLEVKNPFIVCFHHKDHFPKGNGKQEPAYYLDSRQPGEDFDHHAPWRMYYGNTVPGFPVHPHRGFETVTVVTEGFADHFDSLGSCGRYGQGDVQWMTAGAGIQHSEMFPVISETEDNPMELFQIWLNLPKKNKFAEPNYKMLWHEQIPVAEEKDRNGNISRIRVIAGSYKDVNSLDPLPASWAYDRNNHVGIWLITMPPHAELTIPKVSLTLNRMLYCYEGGGVTVEDRELPVDHFADLSGNDDIIIKNGNAGTRLLLLEGEPIRESVSSYGPFVMNTRQEIEQAIADYELTQFGGWQWNSPGPVNKPEDGRFASYKNGEQVEKP